MRQKLLLLAAVFFGILAFMFTYQQINMEKAKIRNSTIELDIIQLKKTLSEGEEIAAEHLAPLRVQRSQDGALSREIPWNKRNLIIGRKVSSMISEGTILTWYAIEQSSEDSGKTGLTARIGEQHKYAVGLPVDAISSLNGLIRPNNRVDVLGTFRLPETKDQRLDTVTLTLLQNVKVLACGTDMGDQASNERGSRSYSTIVLELTLPQAERLIFAQEKGRITLILRRHTDSRLDPAMPAVNWDEFLKKIREDRAGSGR